MVKPIRIQLSRRKGFKLPPNTVLVSRGRFNRWGNPFRITPELIAQCGSEQAARTAALEAYKGWLDGSDEGRKVKAAAQVALRGKNLGC